MNKKAITTVLGALFVITLLLGVVGFLNKDKSGGGDKPSNKKSDFVEVTLGNDTLEFDGLNTSLDGYEFTKQNLSMENGDASASIIGNKVEIALYKGSESEITATIDRVPSPKAVQIALKDADRLVVYVLDEDNNVYRYIYIVNEGHLSDPAEVKYVIPNVASFMIFTNPITGSDYYLPYIVVKTMEGKYVTDMTVTENDKLTLRTFVDPTGGQTQEENLPENNAEIPETNELSGTDTEIEVTDEDVNAAEEDTTEVNDTTTEPEVTE